MEWRVVASAPKYEVSSSGGVRRIGKTPLLTPWSDRGYLKLKLWVKGKPRQFAVSRLVAEAFLPDWDPSKEVDHKNRQRGDNCVTNLRMRTRPQNCANTSRVLLRIKKIIDLHEQGFTPEQIMQSMARVSSNK